MQIRCQAIDDLGQCSNTFYIRPAQYELHPQHYCPEHRQRREPSQIVQFRVPVSHYQQLERMANYRETTVPVIIRELISDYLRRPHADEGS